VNGTDPLVALVTAIAMLAVVGGFAAYCLRDLAHAREIRYLTRQMWAVVIVIAMPVGGMLYLMYGRPR
jgi:hypothetical protein